ncbi:MAG: hypothetical protein EBR82_50010 [Caulobacteraceae bacterium]|nr:hypothetical protein [Caulobacteraceae bacterium]
MGKITLDLAAMYPQTFGDQDALRRAALGEQLQQAQLQRYQQEEQIRQQTQQRQVLPFEDFKIDVNGESIPFKALPPEQKMQWAKQREMDWQLQQQTNFTQAQAKLAKAEVELQQNLQKKKDIEENKAGWMGGEKPGPDWLPGTLFGKPYKEQLGSIESTIGSSEQARNIAGMRLQSIQEQQMPQSYGMPSVVKPAPQASLPQAQPQQPVPQATQNQIPQYNTLDEARNAGVREGDRVIIGGKLGTFKRPK